MTEQFVMIVCDRRLTYLDPAAGIADPNATKAVLSR
jgi:hypothetical protein